MIFTETRLHGAFIIDPEPRKDDRGFFSRTFCEREFVQMGIAFRAVQANVSFNRRKFTLRGMHFNSSPHEEAKIVNCIKGAVYDVIIDMRPESATYNQWISVELTMENRRMLYVPGGFAHGFITLQHETEVYYLMSDFYRQGVADGYRWNDPCFGISWPHEPAVISEKDRNWPLKKR